MVGARCPVSIPVFAANANLQIPGHLKRGVVSSYPFKFSNVATKHKAHLLYTLDYLSKHNQLQLFRSLLNRKAFVRALGTSSEG